MGIAVWFVIRNNNMPPRVKKTQTNQNNNEQTTKTKCQSATLG